MRYQSFSTVDNLFFCNSKLGIAVVRIVSYPPPLTSPQGLYGYELWMGSQYFFVPVIM